MQVRRSPALALVTSANRGGRAERSEEGWCLAELFRKEGELLLLTGASSASGDAERCFRQAGGGATPGRSGLGAAGGHESGPAVPSTGSASPGPEGLGSRGPPIHRGIHDSRPREREPAPPVVALASAYQRASGVEASRGRRVGSPTSARCLDVRHCAFARRPHRDSNPCMIPVRAPETRRRRRGSRPAGDARGSHGTRVSLSVHADPRRRPHPQEPHLLHRARRGHGGGRQARPPAPRLPRGQGARRLRPHDHRRLVERPPLLPGERVEHAREPRRLDHPRLSRDGGGDPSARLPRLHPAHAHGPARPVGQRELARAPGAVPDPGEGPPGDPARDGPRADRDDRARVRGRRPALPRGRARRGRALVRPQPPGRPVLVAALQPADGRVRREPRQPDALRLRGPPRDPPAGRAGTTWSAPASRATSSPTGVSPPTTWRRSRTGSPPRGSSTSSRSSAAPPTRSPSRRGAVPNMSLPNGRVRAARRRHQGGRAGDPDLPRHAASSTPSTPTRSSPTGRSTWSG